MEIKDTTTPRISTPRESRMLTSWPAEAGQALMSCSVCIVTLCRTRSQVWSRRRSARCSFRYSFEPPNVASIPPNVAVILPVVA